MDDKIKEEVDRRFTEEILETLEQVRSENRLITPELVYLLEAKH